MDLKTTLLNDMIEEEVYIEQHEGFETFNRELHICRLKRALYGMKQVPRAWYTRINSYFTGLGSTKSEADVNLYHIMVEGKFFIIVWLPSNIAWLTNHRLTKMVNYITHVRSYVHQIHE